MSVLLVGPPPERGLAIARKLLSQGDEVRAIVAGEWPELRAEGVHLAIGDARDDDLIERAGQQARTVVVFDPDEAALEAVLDGAGRARIERVIVVGKLGAAGIERLAQGALSYVVLRVPQPFLRKNALPLEAVADAVDAADDLGGTVKLEVDLGRESGWTALGLNPR